MQDADTPPIDDAAPIADVPLTARLSEPWSPERRGHIRALLRQTIDACQSRDPNERFLIFMSEIIRLAEADRVLADTFTALRSISMLETRTLMGLTAQAMTSDGPVLEIGSYVGGGTLALAIGAEAAGQKVYSIDKGGAHPGHHEIPSSDIGADWRANMIAAGYEASTTLIEHNYGHQVVWQEIESCIGRMQAGLLVVDADGHVDRAVNLAAPFLTSPSRLVIDDYSWTSNDKSDSTSGSVDNLVRLGYAREAAILGSGTWFGEFRDQGHLAGGSRILIRVEDVEKSGSTGMWRFALPPTRDFTLYADASGTWTRSHMLLLRNGRLHGRPHLAHVEMTPEGVVGFSHWGDHVYFSTPCGVDPRTEHDEWAIVFKGEVMSLIMV